jgi:hypothetical protein
VAGGAPPQRFPFVQFEFAFPLGPADGRYVTRGEDGDPERIVVLRTLGAPRRSRLSRRSRRVEGGAEPEPVPTVRATVIGLGEQLESDEAAQAWLDELAGDADALAAHAATAASELNAMLRAHRAAAADPYVRDVAPAGATAVRVGWGSGDEVADGRFSAARELPPPSPRSRVRRRAEALAPDERLAAVLGRREDVMACEELVLRARADLDAGRPREAALQARVALEAALAELGGEAELQAARGDVARAANEALRGDPDPALQERVAEAVGAIERALRRRRLGRGPEPRRP